MRAPLLALILGLALATTAHAAAFTQGDKTITYATPQGYAIPDEDVYGDFFDEVYDALEEGGLTVHATFVPEAVDAAVRKDPRATVDKYLLVATVDSVENETVPAREFADMQATYRNNPDSLMSGSTPGTAEAPRRVGPLGMTATEIHLGFVTENSSGDPVSGVMAIVHTGEKLIFLYLYAIPKSPETLAELRTEMPGLIAGMAFKQDQARQKSLLRDKWESESAKLYVFIGGVLLALAFALGLLFVILDRKAARRP